MSSVRCRLQTGPLWVFLYPFAGLSAQKLIQTPAQQYIRPAVMIYPCRYLNAWGGLSGVGALISRDKLDMLEYPIAVFKGPLYA
jgi:hypothetical protein